MLVMGVKILFIDSHNPSCGLEQLVSPAPLPWIRLVSFLPIGHYTYRPHSKKGRCNPLLIRLVVTA